MRSKLPMERDPASEKGYGLETECNDYKSNHGITLVIPAAFVTKQIFNKFLGFVLFFVLSHGVKKRKKQPNFLRNFRSQ